MRYLDKPLTDLVQEKFVLVSGPRQVGKTTWAKAWLTRTGRGGGTYLSWDIALTSHLTRSNNSARLSKSFIN